MKKIVGFAAAFVTLLCGGCTSDDEVRVMPEFSYSDHTVTLARAEGSSFTALIATTEPVVEAECDCEWLSVDVDTRRAVFTATQTNDGTETRTTQVTLRAGEFVEQVTVHQSAVEETGGLKVGDPTDDGLGMIFWVDPSDKTVGKAVSLARLESKPFELTMKAHGAESRVDGLANTALYTEHTAEEAAGFCKSLGGGEWYLPALGELNELFDAYNGVAHDDPSFVAATIEALSDPEKMARAAFDKMLTDLGGTVVDATASGNGQSYWSSTEHDEQNTYGVRFGKYASDKWKKSGTTRFVRCVRRVGNYLPPEEPATLTLSTQKLALEAAEGSEKIAWGADDVRFDLSDTDGAVNSAKIAAHEQAAACTALAWCTARGEGWYLPSKSELTDLFDLYNGCHNGDGFTNANTEAISETEKTQRDKIEKLFLDAGGDPLNGTVEAGYGSHATGAGDSYWASNEKSSGTDQAFYVRFGKFSNSATGAKSSASRCVRAVRVVEKTN